MQKTTIFALAGVALILALSAQASAWTYDYHTYVLGHGDVSAGYTNTESSTYEKTSSSVDTPWGSDEHVKIAKTSTESFQPNQPAYVVVDSGFHNTNDYYANRPANYYNDYGNGNYYDGYNWNSYHGADTAYNRNGYTYYDDVSGTNWRYKQAYNYNDYGNDAYGSSYYYQPVYDWHSQVFNWAY